MSANLIAEKATRIEPPTQNVDAQARQRIESRLKELRAVTNVLSDLPPR